MIETELRVQDYIPTVQLNNCLKSNTSGSQLACFVFTVVLVINTLQQTLDIGKASNGTLVPYSELSHRFLL